MVFTVFTVFTVLTLARLLENCLWLAALDTLEGIRSTNPGAGPCPFTLAMGLMGKTVATLTAPCGVPPATMGTVGTLGTSTGAMLVATGGLRDMGDVSTLPWDGDFRSV